MNPHRMKLDLRLGGQIAAHQLLRHRPAVPSKDVMLWALWFRPAGLPFLSQANGLGMRYPRLFGGLKGRVMAPFQGWHIGRPFTQPVGLG